MWGNIQSAVTFFNRTGRIIFLSNSSAVMIKTVYSIVIALGQTSLIFLMTLT
jgi:hypothetical protein